MPSTDQNTYVLKFDYKPGETEPISLLENIAAVLQGFENFNKAICKGIDNDIEVASYLVDIEAGSVRVKVRDFLSKIPDNLIVDLVADPKRVIGQILVVAKHKAIQKLGETKELPQIEKENAIYAAVVAEVREARLNPLLPCDIDRDKLLESVGEITKASKKIDKVSFINVTSEDVEEAEIIDDTFTYEAPQLPQKLVQTANAELIIKKPDLLGTSKWGFVFTNNIDAAIEDNPFLEKVKNTQIGFYCNDKMTCRLRIEVSLNERQEPIETKYFVEKVFSIVPSKNPETPQLFE